MHGLVLGQFPQITVLDLNGKSLPFPMNERQIVFVCSSITGQSKLKSWQHALQKSAPHIKNTPIRGIAIIPKWMSGIIAQPIALLYLRTHLPNEVHSSVYAYFATAEEVGTLFDLPKNTDEDLHLFYLSTRGQILMYTYGSPSGQKLNLMYSFCQ